MAIDNRWIEFIQKLFTISGDFHVNGDITTDGSITADDNIVSGGMLIVDDIIVKRYEFRFINNTGGIISATTGLKVSGWDSGAADLEVVPISADTDLVSCIAMDDIPDGVRYIGLMNGSYENSPLDTSGATIGDFVYVGVGNGKLTLTALGNIKVGIVLTVETEGTLFIDVRFQHM